MAHEDAESLLRALVERGTAEVEVTDDGLLVYVFPDIRSLPGKESSRGVLE